MDEAEVKREIRVFVSSTFRDMQAEREELVKRVFPVLRKLCEQRGVTWGEVDLRWGILDEEKAEGKVLPICLEEIRRCRPYFIGLLGDRYGWVPSLPKDLVEREPWLEEQPDRSVTELEIRHGVLRDPEMASHAYFYSRDPAYIESLPVHERSTFRESETPDEVRDHGADEARQRAEARAARQTALKEEILASGLPFTNYKTPKELGGCVLKDLTALIDRLFPAGENPSARDRENAAHEAFAASRTAVYVGSQSAIDRLNVHVAGSGPPLLVTGESGLGKSALLANWALTHRTSHPGDVVVTHFVGASPESTNWESMIRRLIGEFQHRFEDQDEIPADPAALRTTFANSLQMAASRGRVVLVIDGVDQLEDRNGAPDLAWLPERLSSNIRLLLSAAAGRPLKASTTRAYARLTVEPLEEEQQRTLIREYLHQYGKALSDTLLDRVVASPQASNPLYLRCLLEELRVFGSHELLSARIDHYLAKPTIVDLFDSILERYEHDYGTDRADLVAHALAAIAASRRGLAETEVLDLLGDAGGRLPQGYWAPFFLAAEHLFINRSGLLHFAHGLFTEAVERRYLVDAERQRISHRSLAGYFRTRSRGDRYIDELPWQLQQAGDWAELADVLAEPDFLSEAYSRNRFDVFSYWQALMTHSDRRPTDAYRTIISDPRHDEDNAMLVAFILQQFGYLDETAQLAGRMTKSLRERRDSRVSDWLGLQASVFQRLPHGLPTAMRLLTEQVQLYRAENERRGLAGALLNQAGVFMRVGEMSAARAAYQEAAQICRETGDKRGLQSALTLSAIALDYSGDPDGAIAVLREKERICRELGHPVGLATALQNLAKIYLDRRDLDRGIAANEEVLQLAQQHPGVIESTHVLKQLAELLFLKGDKLQNQGDLTGALNLYDRAEDLAREHGVPAVLARVLGNRAIAASRQGDTARATELHQQGEALFRQTEDSGGLRICLINQAFLLEKLGNIDKALERLSEAEQISRRAGKAEQLVQDLDRRAAVLSRVRRDDEAFVLFEEGEKIVRSLGNRPDWLASFLIAQAWTLEHRRHELRAALLRLEEAFALAQQHQLAEHLQSLKPDLERLRAATGS
jgi:tetratricopeptide (TPR) repeat protein